MAQSMAPASFFYYSQEPRPDSRQHIHGHFAPHPSLQQHQMQMFPVVPTLPSTPIYSRPGSACSQPPAHPMMHHQQMTKPVTSYPSVMTPMASPQPMARKPTAVLEPEIHDGEGVFYPSTPPLSISGSVIGSPGSCDMLSTPLNPMFSGLDSVEGVKTEVCSPESFPALEWSNCASPPMTPGKMQPDPSLPAAKSACFDYPGDPWLPLAARCLHWLVGRAVWTNGWMLPAPPWLFRPPVNLGSQ